MNKIFKELRIPFFTVLFIFFFLWLYAKFAPPLPFTVNSIQTTKQNLFSVDGTGTKTVAPDTAYISFGVTKTANTIADAQNQTNTATTNIINGLKNIGIDIKDIKTTNYSVNPNYNYSGQQQTISAYTITQNIQLTLKPLDKVNKATDVATANGANMVGGVTFGFDEATKKQLQQDVRQMAIKDAKEKAQSLANAGGLRDRKNT